MVIVDLYVALGAADLAWLASGDAVLDAEEQTRASRFRLDRDRELYRAAHVLLRRVLSLQVSYPPSAWQFQRGAHGRPEIDVGACPDGAGLRFNLAHTPGLVCCAVTRDAPVGIDAECHRPVRDLGALATRFFTADEAATVAQAASTAPSSGSRRGSSSDSAAPPGALAFYSLWTLKEAYVKALGRGLSLGLDRCAFRLRGEGPASIGLTLHQAGPYPADAWRCVLMRTEDDRYSLASAVAAPDGALFRCQSVAAESPVSALRMIGASPGVEVVWQSLDLIQIGLDDLD